MKILFLIPFFVPLLAVAVLCMHGGAGHPRELGQDGGEAPRPKSEPTAPPAAEGFAWAELQARARGESGRYFEFLDRTSLSAGVYRIPAGEQDHQGPHELDEVYYVVSGRARLEAGGESWAAVPGGVLFVAAGVEHRFLEISEDLEVLVFFSKAPVGEPGARER